MGTKAGRIRRVISRRWDSLLGIRRSRGEGRWAEVKIRTLKQQRVRHPGEGLFVAEGFGGLQSGGFAGGKVAEENSGEAGNAEG